ncbi:unnamed protein product [Dovyalis caffra]|uniref:Uncharacterized protein n=1 Tax=Dovyalis caffra TaxID=77055 RepID=A0AAV1R6E7_9ROSI|nr:unnamed protein product [Dovyalis caffra]
MTSDNNLGTHAILIKATMEAKIVADVENTYMTFIKNAIAKINEELNLSSSAIKDLIATLE